MQRQAATRPLRAGASTAHSDASGRPVKTWLRISQRTGMAKRTFSCSEDPILTPASGSTRYFQWMAQLLVVEDDAAIRSALSRALTERGHAVSSAPTAMQALRLVLDCPPDLVILDLGLPDLDGFEVLRMLRAISKIPVLIATARDDEADIIRALDAGADDYIVKPFGLGQIEARVRAVLRRTGDEDKRAEAVVVGGLRLDGVAHEAMLDDKYLDLSRREFDLLYYLATHAGQVVTKRDLLTHVWRMPYGGADKTVDVHVSWLRRKLGENAQQPRYLHTIRGVGIKLSAPS